VNFLDSDDDTSRVREAYGDDTYQRLAEIKAKYDPDNVFHNNKNIQPSEAGDSRDGQRGANGNQHPHL
ncbi:MAG TPA: BBE domain-containing protein, partial [Acidimicrobiia bacterium]|nr:BBE domain-containing protein [Acidimicrobiia bacterium]